MSYTKSDMKHVVWAVVLFLGMWGGVTFPQSVPVVHAAQTFAAPFALHGWAWSSNVGWISFNCADTGSCATSNYQVTVSAPVPADPAYGTGTATLNGYAWNSNIGWIQFGNGLTGCPAGSCAATVNFASSTLTGWARALSYGNGWDGWISLNCANTNSCGTSSYAISVTAPWTSTSAGAASNSYAWGSDVVGWLGFSYLAFTAPCAPTSQCTADSLGYTDENLWCQIRTVTCAANTACMNATTPVSCSAASLSGKLNVTPQYARKGDTVKLSWDMSATASACSVTQNNVAVANTVSGSNVVSNPIATNVTTFRLYCTPISGSGSTLVDSEVVQSLPSIFEN